MFEKLTESARRVIGFARKEAERFNHEYIGTEHILLGLLKEESGVGAVVLRERGVELKKIRYEVEKLIPHGPPTAKMGQLPFTPRARKALEMAKVEADTLGHYYIGTEHLLLGLVREGEGVAAQVLLNVGLKLEEIQVNLRALDPRAPSVSEAGSYSLIIAGAGSQGRIVLDILQSRGEGDRVVGLVDVCDNPELKGARVDGVQVLGRMECLVELARRGVRRAVLAIGDNAKREQQSAELEKAGLELESVIHRSAVVSSRAEVGAGSMLSAGSVVCTGARLGRSVIVNTATTVDHDCRVGDFCQLAPGAHLCGNVTLGKACFVGAGAVVLQGLTIGAHVTVGAGAVVKEDLPDGVTAVGIPARIVEKEDG